MRLLILFGAILLFPYSNTMAKTLFFDNFEDNSISNKWDLSGVWEEKDGNLACVKSKVKFNYAVPEIPAEFHSKRITIQAKGKITGLPWSRMGVAVRLTPRLNNAEGKDGKPTGHLGYCLTTPENGPGAVKLLNEGVQWQNLNVQVRPELDQWIWIQLTVTDNQELQAKVWVDGEKEPDKPIKKVKEWLKKNGQVVKQNRPIGPVGLVGKAMEAWGRGGATPVYDEVGIWDAGGPDKRPQAMDLTGKLATFWAHIK